METNNWIEEDLMKTIQALEAPEVQTPHNVNVRKLHETDHVAVMLITLKPGEALKLHVTPVDVFFYLLEGRGTVEIAGEKQTVVPNTLIPSPARIPHRLMNESDALVRFLVVKTPKQTESSRVL